MAEFVVGLDVSSSGAKALALGTGDGKVLGIGRDTYAYVTGLRSGECRLDQAVMMGGARTAVANLFRETGLNPGDCRGIASGGAMHGLSVLDALGEPLDPIVCWDDDGDEEFALKLTKQLGVPIPRRFTIARFAGWRDRNQALAQKAASVLTPASFVTFRGCGEKVVLSGDASGMVGYMRDPAQFDLEGLGKVDQQFAGLLPKVVHFGEQVGRMTEAGARFFGLPAGTPWAGPCGDQPLGSFGKGCCFPGDVSVELGQSIVVNVFGLPVILDKRGLIEALRSTLGEEMSMCCVTNGVQSYVGLFNMLKVLWSGDERSLHEFLDQQAAAVKPGCDGVVALPFLKPEASLLQTVSFGAILGLNTGNFTLGHVVRAFMEAPILILRKALTEMGIIDRIQRVVVSGGGANSTVWPQIIADTLGTEVVVSECKEAVAFGAALNALAMVRNTTGTPVTPDELAQAYCQYGRTFNRTGALPHLITEQYERLTQTFLGLEEVLRPLYPVLAQK